MGSPSGSGLGLVPEYKYCKLPPERLVTGILTIIVQNADYDGGNDYHKDQMRRIKENWDAITVANVKKSFPFGRNIDDGGSIVGNEITTGELASSITDDTYGGGDDTHQDREQISHSTGDYDVFTFLVTANFHCEDKVTPNSNFTIPANAFNVSPGSDFQGPGIGQYLSSSELTTLGCSDTTSGTWALEFNHFGCQSFVRSTLLARHNNAYQHDWHTGHSDGFSPSLRYYNYRNSGIPQKEWHITQEISNSSAPDWFVSTDKNSFSNFENPTSPGRPKVDNLIFQNGVFSSNRYEARGVNVPSGGFSSGQNIDWDLTDTKGTGNVGIDLSDSATTESGTSVGNNTYFNPVYDIQIYGQHPLTVVAGNTATNLDFNFSPVKVSAHPQNWWQMVVEINKWGYQSTGTLESGGSVTADKSHIKTRSQVFFQPFGETQQLRFSSSIYTS